MGAVGLSPRAGPSPPLTRPPHEDPHGCPGAARPVAPISLWTCGQQRVAGPGRVGGRVAPALGPAQRQASAAPRGVPSAASALGSEGAPWHCGPAPCAAATRPPTQPSRGRGDTGGAGQPLPPLHSLWGTWGSQPGGTGWGAGLELHRCWGACTPAGRTRVLVTRGGPSLLAHGPPSRFGAREGRQRTPWLQSLTCEAGK